MNKTEIQPFESINRKIYGYQIPELTNRKGDVKVGQTDKEVRSRIKQQLSTVGLTPDVLFQRKAQQINGEWFTDKQLHHFFILNGIPRRAYGDSQEWFGFENQPERAEELTDLYINLDYDMVQIDDNRFDYILRTEQQRAVDATLAYVQGSHPDPSFLWNAKPRFGKTLTAYDFLRRYQSIKPNSEVLNVLIVTNRPAIANSWYDDFAKFIAWQETGWKFVSETDALRDKAITRAEFVRFANKSDSNRLGNITFVSLQDLKGARFAGGDYEKLRWIAGLLWDVVIVDEAHEGFDTLKTDNVFSKIHKIDFMLHLSGTPFKQIASEKFSSSQIFNWSYADEQYAKKAWEDKDGTNPYEELPTLSLFTYQMSKIIEDHISEGLSINDEINLDYTFNLNEFFRVEDNGKFTYESSVLKFLDTITQGKFPFAEREYKQQLNHTLWLLQRINSAKALQKLLKAHPVFSEYEVVLAAGDGIELADDEIAMEREASDVKQTEKSYDRVKEAIRTHSRTITLSVGQLTTGVTIPEWTGVMMLRELNSPSLYFQAAFRAQNPYEYSDPVTGELIRKENAYVFDFAPDRTLILVDEFANNLKSDTESNTSEKRAENIAELLNFFPVIAEDVDGTMMELNAESVLSIPARIRAREVVERGFMSNLLFKNITSIFSYPTQLTEILDKLQIEKNKKKKTGNAIHVTDPSLNEKGEIDVPDTIIINQSKKIFGDAVYRPIDVNKVASVLDRKSEAVVKEIVKDVVTSLAPGLEQLQKSYSLKNHQKSTIQRDISTRLETGVAQNLEVVETKLRESEKEYLTNLVDVTDEFLIDEHKARYEAKKSDIVEEFQKDLIPMIETAVRDVVEKEEVKVETTKKKTTEDQTRDHLRGFTRTIPAFLMAYGDYNTTLANFDQVVDADTFFELTGITLDEFRHLRGDFPLLNESGEEEAFDGFFDETVFNTSVQEFFDIYHKLANYLENDGDADIFDYIPPQQTNQIFTPKNVVKLMVDLLERENPNIFADENLKFIDLYAKSGLFVAEITKRLNQGLADRIPDEQERLEWIFKNQVYACAPSEIIYNMVTRFVYAEFSGINRINIVQLDLVEDAKLGQVQESLKDVWGEDMKFDVVIGNPPYQDTSIGDNKTFTPAIYHYFMQEAYKLAGRVCMITPARFLFNAGGTPKSWNREMLCDPHLKVVFYRQKSSDVFPNTDIKGGVVITYRDEFRDFGPIEYFSPHTELTSILDKVKNEAFKPITNIMYSRDSYRFTEQLHIDIPDIDKKLSKGHLFNLGTNVFASLGEVFYDTCPQNGNEFIGILGRIDNDRCIKWILSAYIAPHGNLYSYKVFVPKSNGTGAIGEVLSTPLIGEPLIGEPLIGHTSSFVSIGSFQTSYEAEAALKYVKSRFARTMLGTLKVTQDNNVPTWSNVPLQNFTQDSDIDWSQSVDEIDVQLFTKYGLTEQEISFIEDKIQRME